MWLNNIIYEDRVIEGERLEFKDKDGNYYLGPNLTLRRCTLVLRVPARRLHLPGTKLIDCTLEVKTELKNFRWYKAHLKGCRFTGRLTGNDFGHWPEAGLAQGNEGGIEDCDFTHAYLDACRFIGCDASTLRFPRWPCFTLLDPYRRSRELEAVPWPGRVGVTLRGLAEYLPETTAALTESATALAQRFDTTEEALRAVLEKLDGVIY